MLVESDDSIRTSTEELGFATAQFGDEAVKPFTEAVAYAQSEVTAAFRLRQQLDDAHPEDDATKRQMLDEIISRCTEAGRRLDAEAADFDRLRALERTAPEALAHAELTSRDLAARTATTEETLAALGSRYAPSALISVAGHIEQAKDRLVFATTNLGQARSCVDAGDNGRAAVFLRAAESAVDQAGTFVDAVDRLGRELAEAAGKLLAALTESDTDLADAHGLLEGMTEGASTADLRGRVARVKTVAARVRKEMTMQPLRPDRRAAPRGGGRLCARRVPGRGPRTRVRHRPRALPARPGGTHGPQQRPAPRRTSSPRTAVRWAARPVRDWPRHSGTWSTYGRRRRRIPPPP